VARALLAERCLLCVQDPHVDPEVMRREVDPAGVGGGVDELLTCCRDPYEAAAGADAVLVCTEWAEYRALDYRRILAGMRRPAHLFDGRRLLDAGELAALGFRVHVIGSAEAGPPADQPATASP
jgi:UDPglucose 6-dehydrogenase